ncbi:hypothetical protein CVU37_06500 [candidate division BRC1 bacterium HGW-BRC1-1]|jgi:hypothetical protein|nr:MAG: hypothetical protein CVU37_06500 [candidate division BRC1 bacterium HGW-BRC1-1]
MTTQRNFTRLGVVLLFGALMLGAKPAPAQSTIDPTKAFAWSENLGWVNFLPDPTNGVAVTATSLSGFAWSENAGWIHFGSGPAVGTSYSQVAPDVGVNLSVSGALDGFAWGENIGWIVFTTDASLVPRATIAPDGSFQGYAWGENVGWINLNTGNGVRTILPAAKVADWSVY